MTWGGVCLLLRMKMIPCLAALFLATASFTQFSSAQNPKAGGYATTEVTSKEVVAAAAFALKAQQNTEPGKKDANTPKPKLELVKIVQAEQQVVAGVNYRMKLKVKVDGKEKTADVVIWWQAWRKPEPYQLTSWTWQ